MKQQNTRAKLACAEEGSNQLEAVILEPSDDPII